MELKFLSVRMLYWGSTLLIVPYGIEICFQWCNVPVVSPFNRTLWNWNYLLRVFLLLPFFLLIVPYGIEIDLDQLREDILGLLIVPYGIEISLIESPVISSNSLLIVPYGIEMLELRLLALEQITFNRTLWNWNFAASGSHPSFRPLLIVPYGIEIQPHQEERTPGDNF